MCYGKFIVDEILEKQKWANYYPETVGKNTIYDIFIEEIKKNIDFKELKLDNKVAVRARGADETTLHQEPSPLQI